MAYVPTRIAAKRLGVHENTLRAWADNGKIDHIRTGEGKQRRYDVDGFLRRSVGASTVCYCRVSSAKQKDDLARQVEFMREKFEKAEIVQDIGSGLNFKRKGLLALLERAVRGEKLQVVVAHRDRLARFGFELIRWNIEHSDGEVVVLDQTALSPEAELGQDLCSIVHVFSCRINGRRNYKNKKNQALPDGKPESTVQAMVRRVEVCIQQDCRALAAAEYESKLEGCEDTAIEGDA